jgi:hypothetical protein
MFAKFVIPMGSRVINQHITTAFNQNMFSIYILPPSIKNISWWQCCNPLISRTEMECLHIIHLNSNNAQDFLPCDFLVAFTIIGTLPHHITWNYLITSWNDFITLIGLGQR